MIRLGFWFRGVCVSICSPKRRVLTPLSFYSLRLEEGGEGDGSGGASRHLCRSGPLLQTRQHAELGWARWRSATRCLPLPRSNPIPLCPPSERSRWGRKASASCHSFSHNLVRGEDSCCPPAHPHKLRVKECEGGRERGGGTATGKET